MTNSEEATSMEDLLDRLLKQLDEEYIHHAVDVPVEAAACAFPMNHDSPVTQEQFLVILGQFVQHLYARGIRVAQEVSLTQAQAEALSLLERHYHGAHGDGYHAALLDAADPARNGLVSVVSELTAIVRTVERWNYADGILTSAVAPSDWESQRALTQLILDRYAAYWPPNLLRYSSSRMAGEWRALVLVHLETNSVLRSMVGGSHWTKDG